MKKYVFFPILEFYRSYQKLSLKKKLICILCLCLVTIFMFHMQFPLHAVDLHMLHDIVSLFGFHRYDFVMGYQAGRDVMKHSETLLVNVYLGTYLMYRKSADSYQIEPFTSGSDQFSYDWTPSSTLRVPGDYSRADLTYPSKLLAFLDLKTLPFVYKLTIKHSDLSQTGEGVIDIGFILSKFGPPILKTSIPLYYASDSDEIAFSTISVWDAKLKLIL